MTIYLKDIWDIEKIANLEDFKVHFAKHNGIDQPLDVFVRDKKEWQGWQEYRKVRNRWGDMKYIFSLMRFYHEDGIHQEGNVWLFGGIFEVKERHADRYEVELMEQGKEFIGRLKIHSLYKGRTAEVNMENYYKGFEVKEILATPYSTQEIK